MFPSINANKNSLANGQTTTLHKASKSNKVKNSLNEHDKADSELDIQPWESLNEQLTKDVTGIGWSPYGPGGIESTEQERAIVTSFRNFMQSQNEVEKERIEKRQVTEDRKSTNAKRFRTVVWSVAATEELSQGYTRAQAHQRQVQKSEYYEHMRTHHRTRKDDKTLLGLSSKSQHAGRGRPHHRRATKKKSVRRPRVRTPRSSYIDHCQKLGVSPDARIIIGTDLRTYYNFAQAGCSADQVLALTQALGECHSSIIEQLNLSTNNFSNLDLTRVIGALPVDELVSLDLSRNTIGNSSAVELRDFITNEDSNLQDLNLFGCHVRRPHFKTLNTAFLRTKTIRRLHLGRNGIDDHIAEGLAAALRSSNVEELDISWNNICNLAVRFIDCPKLRWLNLSMNAIKKGCETDWADGLAQNTSLQWLDLSGAVFSASECRTIAEGLTVNHTLLEIRMDQMHGCKVRTDAKGFLKVTELTGSTATTVESMTQSQPRSDARIYDWLDLPPFLCRQDNKMDMDTVESAELHGATFDAMKSIKDNADAAWITGGWSLSSFTVDLSTLNEIDMATASTTRAFNPGTEPVQEVNIHFQADNFIPTPMEECHEIPLSAKNKKNKEQVGAKHNQQNRVQNEGSSIPLKKNTDPPSAFWKVDRVLPPGRQFFYFSCIKSNGKRVVLISNSWARQRIQCMPLKIEEEEEEGYEIISADQNLSMRQNDPTLQQSSTGKLLHVTIIVYPFTLSKASSTAKAIKEVQVNFYDLLVRLPQQPLAIGRCLPRPPPEGVVEGDWSLMKSVFVPRLKEADSRSFFNTDRLMKQAFKHDWALSNISAFVTDTQEQLALHQLLKKQYPRLMDIFYHCAGVGMNFSAGEQVMHKWSWMTFNNWVVTIGIQGSSSAGLLTSHDTDIIFITCNVKIKNDNVKPDRFLARYEFLQALVRLAIKRYVWSHELDTVVEALDRFLQDFVYPSSKHIEGIDTWRKQRLYKKGVSDYYMTNLRRLRKRYLQLAAGGGWADEIGGKMSYAEYKEFVLGNGLLEGVSRGRLDNFSLNNSVIDAIELAASFGIFDESQTCVVAWVATGVFSEMHCKLAYTKSMMIVKNDVATFKHKRMTFIDFLEAIGRICDYYDRSNKPLEEKLPHFIEKFVYYDPNTAIDKEDSTEATEDIQKKKGSPKKKKTKK